MVTSRKYITMNIRRPSSVIENIDSSKSNLTPKKILSMHASQTANHQQQQTKTYLPLKRSINTPKKSTFSASNTLSASLNSSLTNTNNSKIDTNHHHNHNEKLMSKINANHNTESTNEYKNIKTEEDLKSNRHLEKKKVELINIPTNRLVNPNSETTRLRQSFFMNEFSSSANKSSNSNTASTTIKNDLSMSNITNIQASFQRYDTQELEQDTSKSPEICKTYLNTSQTTNHSGHKNGFQFATDYTVKYSAANTLPSKHSTTNRSNLNQKTKLNNMKSSEKVSNTGTKANRMNKSLVGNQSQEAVISNLPSSNTVKSQSKGTSYKTLILSKNSKKSNNDLVNGSNHACNQLNTSETGSKHTNFSKNSEQIMTQKSAEDKNENVSQKIEGNSGLVDQMASFIDELKDFIDDRLIDTTSQLEMANQRISGLYYNLNYLTKEFIELKNQNEELKLELQYKNNNSMSQQNSSIYYQRRKNRTSSSFNTKKSDKNSNCEPIAMNSSSKTSSIETTSSSTSESLTMSQTALASSSHESHQRPVPEKNESDKKVQHEETIRRLSRNEMLLILKNQNELNEKYNNKLASSSSSINSVNFYENMSVVNKIDINWPDNSCEPNPYLRTSSQIELNNIDAEKYGSIEFEQDQENYDDHENDEPILINSPNDLDAEKSTRNNDSIEIENYTSKFNKLKEVDLKNSLKQETKIMHHLHTPLIPYSNFRDFDTQYSWDYTDNLVNKFTGKMATSTNMKG